MPDNIEKIGVRAVVENLDKYVRDLKRLTKETDKTGKELEGAGEKSKGFGKNVAASALGFAAAQAAIQGIGIAANFTKRAFIDFEQGIANAGAVAQASQAQLQQMSDAALEIGRSTRFSAVEATGAFEAMAAAGIEIEDILNGGAQAAANLAAAGGVDLPMAADVMSTAMSVWGLSTDDATEAANRLAGAANVSRFQVEDMALAVAQGGGAAAAAGVEFGDFTTSIAAIAPSFSSGSDAGTSFKTFLIRLTAETPKAQEAMKELGLITENGANQFFDAQGNMKSMGEVAGLLQDALGPLTEQQRLQNLQVIFGTDAMRAAAGMMQISREEFDTMSRTMKNTDSAEVAAARMDTLGGRIAFLQSTLETMAIDLGIKVAPALKGLVDGTVKVLETFDQLPGSTKNLILLAGAIGALALTAGPALVNITRGLIGLIVQIKAVGLTAKTVMTGSLLVLTAAIIALDVALNKFTGAGLIGTLTGSAAKAKRMEEATFSLNLELERFTENADKVAFLMEKIGDAGTNTAGKIKELEENWTQIQQFEIAAAMREGKEEIELLGKSMVDANASFEDFEAAANSLEGELREVFEETVKYDLRLEEHESHLKRVAKEEREAATAAAILTLQNAAAAREAEELARAEQELADEIAATQTPFENFIDSIQDSEEFSDDLNDELERMIGLFGELNPTVVANNTQIAFLEEQIGDLEQASFAERKELEKVEEALREAEDAVRDFEGAGEELTAQEEAQLAALEANVEALEEQKEAYEESLKPIDDQITVLRDGIDVLANSNKGFTDNADALSGFRQQIEQTVGPQAFGLLLEDLSNLEDQEAAVDAMGGLANSIALLETDGAAAAIEGLDKLKGQLDPELWDLLASEIGPVFIDSIKNGVDDPAEQAKLLSAVQGLGLATSDEVLRTLVSAEIIGPWVLEMGGQMNASGPDMLAAGATLGGEGTEGVEQGLDANAAIDPFLLDLSGAMAAAESGAFEGGRGVGSSTGQGVVQGLQDEAPAVQTEAEAIAVIVENSMAGFLGIFSPSRVTRGLGAAVSEGFALGILDGKPSVLMVIDGMVEDSVARFEPIADRIVEVADNAMNLFQTGLTERAQEIEDIDTLGRTGARVMESLTRALETGSDRAFEAAGTGMADIFDEMSEILEPNDAAALMEAVMNAMNTVIESGGAEGVDALRAILASVRQLLDETTAAAEEAARKAKEAQKTAGATATSSVSEGPDGAAGGGGAGGLPSRGAPVSGRGRGGRGGISGSGTETFEWQGIRYKFAVNSATRTIEPRITATTRSAEYKWIDGGSRSGFVTDDEKWGNKAGGILTGDVLRKILINQSPEAKAASEDTSILRQASVRGIRGLDPALRGFEVGTAFVPTTGFFKLHAGEMVVPARVASLVRRALQAEGDAPGAPFPTVPTGSSAQTVPTAFSGSGGSLVDVARGLAGPRVFQDADSLGGPTGGGLSVSFDFRGATMTGSLEENKRMMKEVAEDVLGDQVTRGAFLGGRRR
jgi:TP901 family phage tail tape measure protein